MTILWLITLLCNYQINNNNNICLYFYTYNMFDELRNKKNKNKKQNGEVSMTPEKV